MGESITTTDTERTKVDKAMIVVTGTKEKPYFEILYMRLVKIMTILVLVRTT